MRENDDWLDDGYDRPTITASQPPTIIECVNWNNVLGYGNRPEDVYDEIVRQNKLIGPYSQDLSRQISAIEHVADKEGEPMITPTGGFVYISRQRYAEWFNRFFGEVLNRQRMPQSKPKGFWECLFG